MGFPPRMSYVVQAMRVTNPRGMSRSYEVISVTRMMAVRGALLTAPNNPAMPAMIMSVVILESFGVPARVGMDAHVAPISAPRVSMGRKMPPGAPDP